MWCVAILRNNLLSLKTWKERAYLATPLVRERDYSEQKKEWMKFDNKIWEMDFQKKAKEIDFIEKEMTG